MEHRYLGRTGLKVAELCLGTMFFGGATDEKTSHRILDEYVAAGGDFIDTADVYVKGESESVIGRWLAGRDRDDLVIATKVYGRMGEGPNDEGLSRRHILSGVEASLRRLKTDHIDVYYAHVFDDATPLEETLAAFDALVSSGKVRYLGASNFTGWQLQKALDLSAHHGWARFDALQPLYNLIDRETEWELLEVCRREGLGVMPWSPLRAGWLSGRFARGMTEPPADTRVAKEGSWQALSKDERALRVLDVLHELAAETGRTVSQLALRWLIQADHVTSPIIGARTEAHLADNLGAVGWELTPEQVARLDTASDRPKVYPYDVLDRFVRRPS
ncbi:aryl-alcohol dehydrogenase-like predicted oxidoreductase [Stackebrandtia albiflava]|uniref:Aryl-alcohol dehydrogenase-like predicted oxidoreductase n=1 Tax=Stackebrandtia albiflava TaxID=406432 RepID=A0A562VEP3_9ACTN|nr:aldo/keto reductase [Stackebrandtia albiflava]TWJ16328.1 aryl-alcohol dehydrogenase-like predicted oxidoreductase [Stackebrandtia albiflava]